MIEVRITYDLPLEYGGESREITVNHEYAINSTTRLLVMTQIPTGSCGFWLSDLHYFGDAFSQKDGGSVIKNYHALTVSKAGTLVEDMTRFYRTHANSLKIKHA